MNVFDLRNSVIQDYSTYISSFIKINDPRIKAYVDRCIEDGLLWPDPLVQLNPTFEPGKWIDELCDEGLLHNECRLIFRRKHNPDDYGQSLRLYKHQEDAVRIASGELPEPYRGEKTAAAPNRETAALPQRTTSAESEPAPTLEQLDPDPTPAAQLTLSDFGLYKCELCGKIVLGYDRESHAREVHGRSGEWSKVR